ncbi:MAG: hypothetical protein K8L99_18725 [Anaerolineae bacterium]|nr:hypothetical protein [Anaerolineae bacterium]
MSYDITTISVDSPFGVSFGNNFYQADNASRKLMVILPGRGYQVEHPALFYTVFLGLENGFDVLPVQYGFQVKRTNLDTSQMPLLMQDVDIAVQQVLPRGYQDICIVGKSLGTPLAVELITRLDAARKSLILLTPISLALQSSPPVPTLAAIGTADNFYSADTIAQMPEIEWVVLDQLNHGLIKDNDWHATIQAQHTVLERCDQFIKDNHTS